MHTDLYDFDNNSGQVSFYQQIDADSIQNSSSGGNFWGASFSPNNQILYLSSGFLIYNGSAGISQGMAVVQYDLNSVNIESSAVLLYDNFYVAGSPNGECGSPMGSLQLGPDGKIYVGNSCQNGMGIDVIKDPDILGVGCNYTHGGVAGGVGSGYGITNFIESYFGQGVDSCSTVLSNDMCYWINQIECNPVGKEDKDSLDNHTLIYPNPTTRKIRIEAEGIENIKVLNSQGQIVLETTSKELDISNLSDGIYYVVIIKDREIITRKLIKE